MSSSVLTLSSDAVLAEYVGLNDFRGFAETRLAVGPDLAAILIRDGQAVQVSHGAHVSVGGLWQGIKSAIGGEHSLRLLLADLKPFALTEAVTGLSVDNVPVAGEITFELQVNPEKAGNILGLMQEHRAVLKADVAARLMPHVRDRIVEALVGTLHAADLRGNVALQDRLQAAIMVEAERVAGDIGVLVRAASVTWSLNETEVAAVEMRRRETEDAHLKQRHELLERGMRREGDATLLKIAIDQSVNVATVGNEGDLQRLMLSNALRFEDMRAAGTREAEAKVLQHEIDKVVAIRRARFAEEMAAISHGRDMVLAQSESRLAEIGAGTDEAAKQQVRAEVDQANRYANTQAGFLQQKLEAEIGEFNQVVQLRDARHQVSVQIVQAEAEQKLAELRARTGTITAQGAADARLIEAGATHKIQFGAVDVLKAQNAATAAHHEQMAEIERRNQASGTQNQVTLETTRGRNLADLIQAAKGMDATTLAVLKANEAGAAQIGVAQAAADGQRNHDLNQVLRDQVAQARDDGRFAMRTQADATAGVAQGMGMGVGGALHGGPAKAKIVCPQCEAVNDAEARFCKACGTALR